MKVVHADVAVGDEELDLAAFVGSPEADVMEAAVGACAAACTVAAEGILGLSSANAQSSGRRYRGSPGRATHCAGASSMARPASGSLLLGPGGDQAYGGGAARFAHPRRSRVSPTCRHDPRAGDPHFLAKPFRSQLSARLRAAGRWRAPRGRGGAPAPRIRSLPSRPSFASRKLSLDVLWCGLIALRCPIWEHVGNTAVIQLYHYTIV
jgi:hypothetical protein